MAEGHEWRWACDRSTILLVTSVASSTEAGIGYLLLAERQYTIHRVYV
jgi:hypothetical protein